MKCSVLVGPPGCGKTDKIHETIIGCSQRWLLALPRTDLIDEQALALTRKALSIPLLLPGEAIHNDQPKMNGTVSRRVVQALQRLRYLDHAFVLITHAALLDLDPQHLRGWQVAFDEVPERCVISGAFAAGTSWQTLDRLYALHPFGMEGRWCRVVPRAGSDLPTPGEVVHDVAETLREFHRCALTPGRTVLVDIADWQEARSTRRKVRWHSCWTPEALLQHAASVTFAGANVMESLVYRAAQRAPSGPIAFVPVQVGTPRTGRPKVVIHYYAHHEGSTVWWESHDGSRCLVLISEHLAKARFDGYWSGNDVVLPYLRHRFPGIEVPPKVAGTNALRHHAGCAIFYSSKAQTGDEPAMEALGLNREDIRRAREDEDIIQFVFRGRLRDSSYDGPYEVHLYSQRQAEMLRAYLISNNITDDIDLVPVRDAGVMEIERPQPKVGKRPEVDPVTRAEREEARAEKARVRAKKNRDKKKAERTRAIETAAAEGRVSTDFQMSGGIEVKTATPSALPNQHTFEMGTAAMPVHTNPAVPPPP